MRRQAASERGFVLATAMILMLVMLSMGLATMKVVDSQQHASRISRERDDSFNLAEGALEEQSFVLSSSWSQSSSTPYATCDQATTATTCPSPPSLSNTFTGVDYSGATWSTQVFDNSSTTGGNAMQSFYSDALAANAPRYDKNGDGQLWVRASATVRGHTRVLVALVKWQQNPAELFPLNTITAGHFSTTDNGKKTIVDLQGNSAQAGPMRLRCTNIQQSSCLNAVLSKGQISPAGQIFGGYTGGPALSQAAIGRLRATAKAQGTYYSSCPGNPSGKVVFIESGTCSWNDSAGPFFNSATSPGVLVINNGSVSFGGNITYYGAVYAVNAQNSASDLVSTGGTSEIVGAIAVDGAGGVSAGASGLNVSYDANAVVSIRSYGTTGIVENTWRELLHR